MFKLLLLAVVFVPVGLIAQSYTISGTVKSRDGKPISGAFAILKKYEKGAYTNDQGKFTLNEIQKGTYTIIVSHLQYKNAEINITLDKETDEQIEIVLTESTHALSEVQVEGKSDIKHTKEQPLNVSILEGKKYYDHSASTTDLINRVSGIRVRQDGGYGSNANFSLNGISGKQVKFFVDGVPIEFFGKGLGMNVVPVGLIERIDIYKGVIPISLGGDALGGALNLVTRKSRTNFVEGSYSFGSFNTHKSALTFLSEIGKKGFYILANGSYNYSDNNYKIDDVPLQYEQGVPVKGSTRRFHDQFSNILGRIELGVNDIKWADKITISGLYSQLYDEIQHPFAMFYYPDSKIIVSEPYGQAVNQEKSAGVAVSYRKKALSEKLSIEVFSGINFLKSNFTDTTLNVYRWDGKVERRKDQGGEISSSMNLLTLNSTNTIFRGNISYLLSEFADLAFSGVISNFGRSGRDPVAAKYYGEDIFTRRTLVNRNIFGTSLKVSLLNRKLESITSLKYFNLSANGFAVVESNKVVDSKQRKSKWGWNEGLKFSFNNQFLLKASYEHASRLPDETELLGNYYFIKPNKDLIPETSNNFNIGAQYGVSKLSIDVNGFYRDIEDYIFLEVTRFSSQYKNLLKARITGVEGEVVYRPLKFLSLSANATYQDIRNKSTKENSGTVDNRYYNSRLPNQPIFFSNFEVVFNKPGFLMANSDLSLWWNANYVSWFYLYWEKDGRKDTKSIIPRQFIQNIGASYTINKSLSFSLEAFNVLNEKAYDNFSVQRPGRSFSVKARYFMNLNSKITNH